MWAVRVARQPVMTSCPLSVCHAIPVCDLSGLLLPGAALLRFGRLTCRRCGRWLFGRLSGGTCTFKSSAAHAEGAGQGFYRGPGRLADTLLKLGHGEMVHPCFLPQRGLRQALLLPQLLEAGCKGLSSHAMSLHPWSGTR